VAVEDELWKETIGGLFPQFLSFFAPDLAKDVLWHRGYELLDSELHQIASESEETTRYVDRLVKVWLRDGEERWILVHVEVQGYRDPEFPKRMFTYFYRLWDKFGRDIVSLVVFSDPLRAYKPGRFLWEFYGCRLEYRYRTYKVLDYNDQELEKSDNPFGLVVLAAKRSLEAGEDEARKYRFKRELLKMLLERGYDRDEVRHVFRFLDGMLKLDREKEKLLYEEFHREGVKAMPYVTSWERIAMEKGMKKGMEKGMEKGSLEEAREMVLEALEERFGVVPPDLEEVIRGREDRDVLRKWLRLAIRVGNLEEFRKEAGV